MPNQLRYLSVQLHTIKQVLTQLTAFVQVFITQRLLFLLGWRQMQTQPTPSSRQWDQRRHLNAAITNNIYVQTSFGGAVAPSILRERLHTLQPASLEQQHGNVQKQLPSRQLALAYNSFVNPNIHGGSNPFRKAKQEFLGMAFELRTILQIQGRQNLPNESVEYGPRMGPAT